jgi:hypothetical protein
MLGDISGKYESGNRAGAVSAGIGDLGGVSYGAHQFIAPVADNFTGWLKEKGHPYGGRLGLHKAGTPEFSAVWREIAAEDSTSFLSQQHEYTKIQYYDKAVELLAKENFHADNHSTAVREMIFSRAVQYGAAWIPELFVQGMKFAHPSYLNLSYIDAGKFDEELISGVYDFLIDCCDRAIYNGSIYFDPERWTCGSYDVVKIGLRNRFFNEKKDLLELLREGGGSH